MLLNHLATDMQSSILLLERFTKLSWFECLKMCQTLDANMEGFC